MEGLVFESFNKDLEIFEIFLKFQIFSWDLGTLCTSRNNNLTRQKLEKIYFISKVSSCTNDVLKIFIELRYKIRVIDSANELLN